ncbi:hypothetical protein FQZ97_712780 [compost metagenome]
MVNQMKLRFGVGSGWQDHHKCQSVVAIEAGFGPGDMPWEVSDFHRDLRLTAAQLVTSHYGP